MTRKKPDLIGFADYVLSLSKRKEMIPAGSLDQAALRFGLLAEEIVQEPCATYCACSLSGSFPAKCYTRTFTTAQPAIAH